MTYFSVNGKGPKWVSASKTVGFTLFRVVERDERGSVVESETRSLNRCPNIVAGAGLMSKGRAIGWYLAPGDEVVEVEGKTVAAVKKEISDEMMWNSLEVNPWLRAL